MHHHSIISRYRDISCSIQQETDVCETNDMKTGNKYSNPEEEEYLSEPEDEKYQENNRDVSRDLKPNIRLRKIGKKYAGIPEEDFYQFMLYKFRQDDMDFIMDIFEGADFLGPSILKAYKKDYRGELTFRELMDELYLHLKENDWKALSDFRGECSLVIWLRSIASKYRFIFLRLLLFTNR